MDAVGSGMSQIPGLELPPQALAVDSWLTGGFAACPDGRRHMKTASATIIAIALRGSYEVRRRDGSVAVAQTGEAFLAQEGEWLDIVHRGDRPGGSMAACWVHLRVTVFGTLDACRMLDLPPILSAGPTREVRQHIEADGAAGPGLAGAVARAAAALTTVHILTQHARLSARAAAPLGHAASIAPLAAWVSSRLGENICLDELAAMSGMSKSRLHARMRRELGLAPMAWVRELRLQAARTRLLAGDEPVGVIAAACGFPDQFHFSRAMRARFGLSPTRVRESRSLG